MPRSSPVWGPNLALASRPHQTDAAGPTMTQAKGAVLIRVDHREMASGVPECLGALEWVITQVEQLEMADYVLSSRVAVERKSASDFVSSILDKRLFSQVEQLKQVFDLVVYLVEGEDLYSVRRVHPNAIRGALSYLMILGGVSVVRTSTPEDSAVLLATMARHEQQGLGYELSLNPKRRNRSRRLQMRYLVEDLPGIGPRMADRLLQSFTTVRSVFSASEADLCRVAGIGPTRARRIVALLSDEYTTEPGESA